MVRQPAHDEVVWRVLSNAANGLSSRALLGALGVMSESGTSATCSDVRPESAMRHKADIGVNDGHPFLGQCGLPVRGVRIRSEVCRSSRRRFDFGIGCSDNKSPLMIFKNVSV